MHIARVLRRDKHAARKWTETESSKVMSPRLAETAMLSSKIYRSYLTCQLSNKDRCSLNDWVIWKDKNSELVAGRVLELLQIVGSPSELNRQPDIALIHIHFPQGGGTMTIYGEHQGQKMSSVMPRLFDSGTRCVVGFLVCEFHL